MGRAFACAGLVTLALSFGGAARAGVRAVIVEWGEIEGERGGPLGPEYNEHSLGPGSHLAWSRFINHDTDIPAQQCRRFGIEAWLTKGPDDVLPDRMDIRVRHPLLTRPDGATRSEDTLSMPVENGRLGEAYTFDQPWEAQPGPWTFELMVGGEVVAAKTFTVRPREAGMPASVCPERAVS